MANIDQGTEAFCRREEGKMKQKRKKKKKNDFSNLDSIFALSKCVPQLDGFVSASRYNLSVISRESYTQHILKEDTNLVKQKIIKMQKKKKKNFMSE